MGFEEIFLYSWSLVRMPIMETSVFLNNAAVFVFFSLLLVLAVSVWLKEQKKLAFLASALVIAVLLGLFFKPFLGEVRPCVESPGKIPCPTDYSLPSMHALAAFTLAIVSLGNRSFPIYLIYAVFIAFSRVYLGVHTIIEVAAGLALAFFACVLSELFFRQMKWAVPRAVHIKHDAGKLIHSQSRTKIGGVG